MEPVQPVELIENKKKTQKRKRKQANEEEEEKNAKWVCKTIKDQLTCPVCKELLKEACTLSACQHVFCERCIEGILESSADDVIRCPVCRESGEGYCSNMFVCSLVETIAEQERREVQLQYGDFLAERFADDAQLQFEYGKQLLGKAETSAKGMGIILQCGMKGLLEAQMFMGNAEVAKGRHGKAIYWFNSVSEACKNMASATMTDMFFDAQFALGKIYTEAIVDQEKAMRCLTFPADSGHGASAFYLAEMMTKEHRYAEAALYYRQAADTGNFPKAAYHFAYCNKVTKWTYMHIAAIGGVTMAMVKLAEEYEREDIEKAVELYTLAEAGGNGRATLALGMYYLSIGNEANGIVRLLGADELGFPRATLVLGKCYECGKGVERDLETAAELYKKAAFAFNARAEDFEGAEKCTFFSQIRFE